MLETQNEWKTFMSGIAKAFSNGEITYDIAKKYANLSSSIFSSKSNSNKAYAKGFIEGLDTVHNYSGSRLSRKIQTFIDNLMHNENNSYAIIMKKAELNRLNNDIIPLKDVFYRLVQDI